MASPTPREIAMEARKREFDAKRRAANRQSGANLLGMASNPGALLRGALDIPGSVYRYLRDNEPVEIGEDVSRIASDMAGDFRKDPVKFAVDMVNPVTSVQDFADIRAQARDLRAAGDLDTASMLEQVAAMSPLAVVPVVGKVLGKGAKVAAKAAAKKAASLAVKPSTAAAEKASSFVVKPSTAAAEKAPLAVKPIATYHASPHLFDKFDISKVGTGEGAQSYGHGMYLAESPEVGGRGGAYDEVFTRRMNYRDQMADLTDRMNRATVGGKPVAKTYNIDNDPELLSAIKKRDVEEVLRRAREQMDHWHELSKDSQYPYRNYAEEYLKGYEKLSNDLHGGAELYYPSRANIYEVDFHTDPDRLLNWDKPHSQQTDYVRGVLENLGYKQDKAASAAYDDALYAALTDTGPLTLPKEPYNLLGEDIYSSMSFGTKPMGLGPDGSVLYDATAALNGRNPVQASNRLKDAGIPGIRYLDQGSRGAGSGTSNYVVFDPDLLEIKRRYAKGGATAKTHGGRVSSLAVKRKGKK